MALILERNCIEAIPQLSDSHLMEACAEAEPLSAFQVRALAELTLVRGYSHEEIQDEVDRVLYLRAQERKADREEHWRSIGESWEVE